MSTIGAALVWCAIQVTIFTVAAVFLCAVAHRLGTRAGRQAALCSLMVVMLLAAMAFSPWPNWGRLMMAPSDLAESESITPPTQSASDGAADADSRNTANADSVQPSGSPVPNRDDSSRSDLAVLWSAFVDEMSHVPMPTAAQSSWDWRAAVGVFLLFVALVGFLRIVLGMVAVRRLISGSREITDAHLRQLADVLGAQLSCTRPVELRQSPRLVTAATVGWWRPVILLPCAWRDWTTEQRRVVLAHELAHIRQADFVAQLAAQFAVALHFYHPLVHWLARRLRLEQELTADDLAAAVAGGRRAYLNTLADLALAQPSVSVGWPAQMFLPTRGTFLRRIEMLRDSRDFMAGRRLTVARWLTAGMLVLAGLMVVGIRLPNLPPSQAAVAADTLDEGDAVPFDLTFAPENTVYSASFRLADLSRDHRWQTTAELLHVLVVDNSSADWSEQIMADKIEEASVIVYRTGVRNELAVRTVLRVSPTIDLTKEHARLMPDFDETDLSGRIHLGSHFGNANLVRGSGRSGFILVDKHTMVIDNAEHFKSLLADDAKPRPVHVPADGQILLIGRPEHFKQVMDGEAAHSPEGPLQAFSPLWEDTVAAQLVIRLGDGIHMESSATCKSADAAEKVEGTARALLTLAENLLAEPPEAEWNDSENKLVQLLLKPGKEALKNARLTREETDVTLTSSVEDDQIGLAMAPALRSARAAARRAQSINNLRQLAVAMHTYNEAHEKLPPAVLYGPDGKTPYSWRVALLPYLGQQRLYDAYRFDEPWDGPNNRKLLSKIPAVYRHPSDPSDSTNAAYFVLTGPDTVFSGKEGTRFLDMLDGPSYTIMFVEAKRMIQDAGASDGTANGRLQVPWTRPDLEIEYGADTPVTNLGLGGFFDGGFCAGFCDGSIRFIANTIDQAQLRAMFTKASREPVSLEGLRQ